MNTVNSQIINKFNELKKLRVQIVERIADDEARLKEIKRDMADCKAAARLFGVDLDDADPKTQGNLSDIPEDGGPPTIRHFCLFMLKDRMPKGMRAKELQECFELSYDNKLHSKTIGMTLYRLSKENLVHRDGWDWYYANSPRQASLIDPVEEEDTEDEVPPNVFG